MPSDLQGAVRQSSQASAEFVSSGGMRAIVCTDNHLPFLLDVNISFPSILKSWLLQVELLIPQLQFLDDEGAQSELWELSRIFVDTLIEETGCQVS